MDNTEEKIQEKTRLLQLEKIKALQEELGTIEILEALKAGIDEDLSDFDEEMKDPDPKLRPCPETKPLLEVYEMELRTVIEHLNAVEGALT